MNATKIKTITTKVHMKGFTLIELLVVIGIIGILAAALLAALDPIEQLKRGRDTQKRSAAVQYQNALNRYYAINGSMPWGAVVQGITTLSNASAGITTTLVAAGELKSSFQNLPTTVSTAISVMGDAAGAAYVCFDPDSKAISGDPGTAYTLANPPGACNPVLLTTCNWCAR